jgi:hypothetical protein
MKETVTQIYSLHEIVNHQIFGCLTVLTAEIMYNQTIQKHGWAGEAQGPL